jgi:hypothetical protein
VCVCGECVLLTPPSPPSHPLHHSLLLTTLLSPFLPTPSPHTLPVPQVEERAKRDREKALKAEKEKKAEEDAWRIGSISLDEVMTHSDCAGSVIALCISRPSGTEIRTIPQGPFPIPLYFAVSFRSTRSSIPSALPLIPISSSPPPLLLPPPISPSPIYSLRYLNHYQYLQLTLSPHSFL